jgi:hypothetical protein
MRAAVDDVSRLTDFYVAMPKPSSDGDLAVKLAKRTYELADAELKRALKAYKAAMEL